MRFVHIGDTHIGMGFQTASFGKVFGKEKRKAIKKNLIQVIEYIKTHKIELLLIAGDFVEGNYVELGDLYDVNYLFESIPNTQIVIMAGNHDPMRKDRNPYQLIQWSSNVDLIGTSYSCLNYSDINTSIISVSWESNGPMYLDTNKLEETIALAKEDIKILLLHGDIYNVNEYMCMDTTFLKNLEVDYIALGHIHKHDIIEQKIAYPGSLEPLDFSEVKEHGFILGEINNGNKNIEFIKSMIYPMVTISTDITSCHSMLEVIDIAYNNISQYLKENNSTYTKLMIRIEFVGQKSPYIGAFSDHFNSSLKERLFKELSYIEYKDKTTPGYEIQTLYKEHHNDLIGYFIKAMEEKGLDDEVNQHALTIGITLLLEAMG